MVIKLHNKHAGHDMAMTNWFLPMFKHLILIILLNIIWKGFKKLFIYQDKPILKKRSQRKLHVHLIDGTAFAVSELEQSTHANGFLGKAFGQAWMLFKEQKRATSVALNSYLTYITLPWHWIIAGTVQWSVRLLMQTFNLNKILI